MKNLRAAAFVAILVGLLVMSGRTQAGDINGKVSAADLKSAGNISVYIDTIPGKKFDRPTEHVSVDQRNMVFVPHVLVVLRGTTVDFLNSDQVAHNVYWPSVGGNKTLRHSLTIVSPGQKKSFQFDDLGSAQLLCNMHSEMIGYVVVVPTPYFATTGSDGTFTIKNVPAGTYTLKTWSADGKPSSQSITVTDAPTNVDITVKK
jgi:plastocyanin